MAGRTKRLVVVLSRVHEHLLNGAGTARRVDDPVAGDGQQAVPTAVGMLLAKYLAK